MEKSNLLSPDKALSIILESTVPLQARRIHLSQALDRVLAEDVCASGDLPPFDNCAMDGYAVVAADTAGAAPDSPRRLRVLAEEPAGSVVGQTVTSGTAVAVMTGAAIPPGADAVVIVEHTKIDGDDVLIQVQARPGDNVRPAGEDVKQGTRVLKSGCRIGPGELAMLAALGVMEPAVYERPKVAIITTGSELVDAALTPGPGQIRNSNQWSLSGQVKRLGAEVSLVRHVADEPRQVREALSEAVEVSDAVITCGGVSVGKYDFVKEVLRSLGDIRFWKVAIKPGKPFVYGHIQGKPLFGLPGNPVSSMVTFDVLARPGLLKMSGLRSAAPTVVSAKLADNVKHKPGRREYVRVIARWENGGYVAHSTGKQSSGILSSMLGANAYLILPEDSGDASAGETLQMMLVDS